MPFRQVLYGPIYRTRGVAATLTIGAAGYSVTALDMTSGLQLPGPVELETTRPVAAVLAGDLADLGIDPAALDGATLALNGATWNVIASRAIPTPYGKADGEVYLILEGTGEA